MLPTILYRLYIFCSEIYREIEGSCHFTEYQFFISIKANVRLKVQPEKLIN